MISRQNFLKGLLGTALAGLLAASYGLLIAPALRLRVQRRRVKSPSWGSASLRIVAISDIHLGEPFVGLRRLWQLIAACGIGCSSALARFEVLPEITVVDPS